VFLASLFLALVGALVGALARLASSVDVVRLPQQTLAFSKMGLERQDLPQPVVGYEKMKGEEKKTCFQISLYVVV
jgi:hypothetical protein